MENDSKRKLMVSNGEEKKIKLDNDEKYEQTKEDCNSSSSVDKNGNAENITSCNLELSENKNEECLTTLINNSEFTSNNKTENKCDELTENDKQDKSKLDFEGVPTTNPDGTPILFNGVEVIKLTKSQLKKYKKMVKWEAEKKEKRAKERQKKKQKIYEAKLDNKDLGPSRKALKNVTMAKSSCKINVVIDMSFDDLMINKDIGKVIKQTLRIYTKNRRSLQPMQLHLTSFEGKVKDEMAKHDGYENWDLNFHQVSYLDVFPKDKLVYLSSESENVITKLEDDKVYIIGGLVDHNSHKGVCYKKAVEQGISHGQLPISEYFQFKSRKVFTINQVFEILLEVSQGKSFKEAFEMTLPKRINMQPKAEDEDSGDAQEDL